MAEEIITYLSMTSPKALRGPRAAPPAFDLVPQPVPDPATHRDLYRRVGADWQWTDRLAWSLVDWRARDADAAVALWVAEVAGTLIGFVELDGPHDGAVEIAYFGLLPEWIGQGYGAAVLHDGVARAWATPGTRRVWVHTSNFDHHQALANYRARGFEITHIERVALPSAPLASAAGAAGDERS